jgi:phosphatidylserine decarboxylase
MYRDGWYFVIPGLIISIGLGLLAYWIQSRFFWIFGALFGGVTLFTLFFFRDPDRKVPKGEGTVVSPADGRVLTVEKDVSIADIPGNWIRISIYLSLWNVHINRIPVSGTVVSIRYTPGRFFPAFTANAGARNENNLIRIHGVRGDIFVRQIAGIVARRIVCRIQEGDRVHKGERMGIIRFGSRTELYLPIGATVSVEPGSHVKGGTTILGVMSNVR